MKGYVPGRPVFLMLALTAAAALSVAVYSASRLLDGPRYHATAYVPAEPAPDFRLRDHTGRVVSLENFRGRASLLFFGYTHCPDVCPLTLDKLRRALRSAGIGPEQAHVLLVTVDPERDTPQALARYVSRFGPGVSGLTGGPEALRRLAAAYGVHAQPTGDGHMSITHTGAVFGIDADGRLRVLLRPETADAELAEDLRTLVDE